MKIAYTAHPISGDVENNLNSIALIVRQINLTEPDVVPFAPYYADCEALFDGVRSERDRGIKNNVEIFRRGIIDELRLYGERISPGMRAEIHLARKLGIKILAMTPETRADLKKFWAPHKR